HVLRHVFETAPDYATARQMLTRIPIARAAIFVLVGIAPSEACVIERQENEAHVIDGKVIVGNDWQRPCAEWEPRTSGGPIESDSRDRCETLGRGLAFHLQPFDWLVPPVHASQTRIAVEMCAGDGSLRVVGFESVDPRTPSVQATRMLDLKVPALAWRSAP